MIEGEQPLIIEGVKKLKHEERIAGGLCKHQLRERRGVIKLAAKRIGDQPPDVFMVERPKLDLADLRIGAPDRRELRHQRMGGVDLVVPIGADQQQVLNVPLGQEILEQVERRRVQPLQVVEEERQRMFRCCEYADEATEHELKAPLRLLRLKLGDRRLIADDEVQFGDEVGHEPAVRAQRLQKGLTPIRQLGDALAEQGSHKALKSLCQGRIGNVALQLVELA